MFIDIIFLFVFAYIFMYIISLIQTNVKMRQNPIYYPYYHYENKVVDVPHTNLTENYEETDVIGSIGEPHAGSSGTSRFLLLKDKPYLIHLDK